MRSNAASSGLRERCLSSTGAGDDIMNGPYGQHLAVIVYKINEMHAKSTDNLQTVKLPLHLSFVCNHVKVLNNIVKNSLQCMS